MAVKDRAMADICDLMSRYLEGLYQADTGVLAGVFHPDARYVNMTEGDYMNKSLAEYFSAVEKRIPPAVRGDTRRERIISVEFGGERMAFVKASMTMMGREYLDFLTLTCDQHGWRIMSKVFSYVSQTETV
ncbi:nuclear transport factor 2 family protein [Aliamphritea hakodatensis]|uniref:nuclear transport factor 2 family protein n=1 Tax=Aliamphritea hakodatensis TaxID=2895352 RepID=UPI0022FD7DFC|nr:nuclear transport factor 2 family protein [Aliamphritea hakodatensis]